MRPRPTPHPDLTRRKTMLGLLCTALLPACGGSGTDMAGISSGGTGSFTTGTITGLGSIIVNDIRYDDRSASVTLDGAAGAADQLKLGMVVRIQGSAITAGRTGALATATASRIASSSEWKGVAQAVDTGAGTFTLLGQTVRVRANTVFDGALLATLSGRVVEVHGFVDPTTGSLTATRVEIDSNPVSNRLSGSVTGLDTGSQTFRLGSAAITYAGASGAAGVQNGHLVRVELQTSPNGSGQWVATAVNREDVGAELEDQNEAELEGTITAYTSPASFSVSGVPVNAGGVPGLPTLGLGLRVNVKGKVRSGVVVATKVDVENDGDIEALEYEFHGTVSALNVGTRTFVVRGYTVHYDATTVFDLGSATWANGLGVEVKTQLDNSTGQLLATQIETED